MKNKRLLEIFLDLAHIDSVSGNEKAVSLYIQNFLTNLRLSPYTDNSQSQTGSNTGNVICKINGGGNLLLSSHMDTARSTAGVKPQLLDDRITSDGTTVLGVDNRAGIAILLAATEHIINDKIETEPYTLVFPVCEETTLFGSRYMEIDREIKMGFVFDSYMNTGKFIASSYGAAGYKVKIKGKASHSGIAPEAGINAIVIAVNALSKIKTGRIDENTNANVGLLKGGSAVNVVPDNVEIEGEIRSVYKEKVLELIEETKEEFEKAAEALGGSVEFVWVWDFMPFKLKDDSLVYQKVKNAITKSGLTPEEKLSAGGSDANSYNGNGIEAVNLGIGAQNPHSNDEFILYEDFENAFKIAIELIKK
ncbi:MAG: M20/M25/M40 family metallo-hydrolase [Melioribacteraceae bacterium]|nr:M20/M25/M40 family metallo-hydrolase [Melioribacteraceae bacterium]